MPSQASWRPSRGPPDHLRELGLRPSFRRVPGAARKIDHSAAGERTGGAVGFDVSEIALDGYNRVPRRSRSTKHTGTSLRVASSSDLDAMMAIESIPTYADQVGRWPRERHLEEMALPSSRYFVLEGAGGDLLGFAILQGLGDSDRKTHLKRIAVREPGKGFGSLLLRLLLDWVYRETETHRVDLDVFRDNPRARRAYEKAGFTAEGLLRDYHRRPDGSFASMWLMSILRPEWRSADRAAHHER
jgi:RimJ/RimL family protein N-acetyltransferase